MYIGWVKNMADCARALHPSPCPPLSPAQVLSEAKEPTAIQPFAKKIFETVK